MTTNAPPWASGPGEILRHGLSLLKKDNDTNRRLAMISIDNAVELMIKTYLGLPKRVTGLAITRKDFQEISESFPAMLDALEKHASTKLVGIDLGEIERPQSVDRRGTDAGHRGRRCCGEAVDWVSSAAWAERIGEAVSAPAG